MLAVVLAAALALPQVPDPAKTPGAVNPAASVAVICQRGYTSRPGVRHVTAATKRKVFAAYGLDPHGPGAPFEVDHLISLELGGSNDASNLWPQSYVTTPWNAHVKDRLENRLHALVCSGKVPLDVAQKAISTAWIGAYLAYVGPTPPAKGPTPRAP
jgi:hypothetical protein